MFTLPKLTIIINKIGSSKSLGTFWIISNQQSLISLDKFGLFYKAEEQQEKQEYYVAE